MKIEALDEALSAVPFVPFRMILPSDSQVPVPHTDFVPVSPNRKWLLVWNKSGGWSMVEPALIVELAFNASHRRR